MNNSDIETCLRHLRAIMTLAETGDSDEDRQKIIAEARYGIQALSRFKDRMAELVKTL